MRERRIRFKLLHLYNEVLAGRPEALRIGDAEHILLLGIALERVAACGVIGQNLGRRTVELDLLVDADINLGEVFLVEVRLQHLTKIDIRIDKEIKLYSSSAEILTNHPAGSYTLQRDAKKQYVLRITDPNLFWSTSKYLVIQVK